MNPSEPQVRAFEAYKANGYRLNDTARALGITKNNLKKTLFNGHLCGLTIPTQYCKHLPAGMGLKAASVYVNKDGEVSGAWYKGKELSHNCEDFANFLEQRTPISSFVPQCDFDTQPELMLEWPIYDAHLGMLAWEQETGADYDTAIARHLQVKAGEILFHSFGRVRRITIILGGDNITSDNRQGMTERSGNVLDTDSRFAKMVWCSYETSVACIEMACQFADEVHVIVLSGNHDWHGAVHLTIQLHAHFRNVDKVKIDRSPEKHRFYIWGNNVFMATHGDVNEKRIAPYAMQQVIRRGLASGPDTRIMVRMGHLHKRGRKTPDMLTEEDGVVVERFPTLAAQEAYSIEGAYTSIRATSAVLWHSKYGRFGGREIVLGEILERFPIHKQR